jgi:hypothetical protein
MWHADLLDEVALEGLAGVTLNTLWVRLANRPGFQFGVQDDRVRGYLWRAVLCNPSISSLSYFTLSADRLPVVVKDRFQDISDTGMFNEDQETGTPAEPLSAVTGKSVRGSCNDMDERADVTADIYGTRSSLSDVMAKYGDRLVIVASQEDRNKALGLNEVDPFLFMSEKVYAYLELVGRRRHQGLASIGSDASIGIDNKTAFYYRKSLMKNNLIRKCPFHLVMKGKTYVTKGNIVFLSRFYRKVHSPIEQTAARLSDILMQEPDQECEVLVLRDKIDNSSKRMFNQVFQEFAPNFHCFLKELTRDQSVIKRKVVRLVKPVNLDVDEKEDNNDVDSDGEDDDGVTAADFSDETLDRARLFDPTRILADRTILSQILMAIEQSESGLSLRQIGQQFSLNSLDSRLLTKLLVRAGKVKDTKEELGKTRVSRFCSIHAVSNPEAMTEIARNDLHIPKLETVLKLKRANIILKALDEAEDNIVFGLFYFVKHIRQSESESRKFCDPKTVHRLLATLEKDGKLRVHEFTKVLDNKTHRIHVVTKPGMAKDDVLLQNKAESYFFRIGTRNSRHQQQLKMKRHSKNSSKRKDGSDLEIMYEYNPSIGKKKYGCLAKMRKIFTLYKFLFHQLWVLSGKSGNRRPAHNDWRTHIRPISEQMRRVPVRDLIPRIPVSIFCQIVNVTHEVPGLEDLLLDPETRNNPLNKMPEAITKGLLFGRKYVYNILSLLTSLMELGLVELGNADAFDKDEVTVKVLNQTSFTHAGNTTKFAFKCLEDIEKFEDDIAMHCESLCTGCSLPKNLFAHQMRNWYEGPRIKPMHLFTTIHVPPESGMEITVMDPQQMESSESLTDDAMLVSRGRSSVRGRRNRNSSLSPDTPRKRMRKSDAVVAASAPDDSLVANVPRKRKKALDDKDKYALSIMTRRRCIWSPQEDTFLLLCRVATLLLGQETPMFINTRVVRDQIHSVIPHSQDKTTFAIRRRILYMMKEHRTLQNVLDWVSEFRLDDTFAEIEVPAAPKTNTSLWTAAFTDTLTKVRSKFSGPRDDRIPIMQDMDEQSLKSFDLLDSVGTKRMKRTPIFVDPKNCVDIHVNAVENVLISSLILSSTGVPINERYDFSLFRIYQRYPDTLIRSVVTKMKKNNIMALRKKNRTHISLKRQGVTPYKLSRNYSFLLQTKYTMDSLIGAIDLRVPFENSDHRNDVSAIVSLFTSRSAKFNVVIPEDFIALDKENPFGKTATKAPRDTLIAGDKRCSSRSVLYAFREQLSLNTRQPNDKIQDYLVLNKCSVSVESAITDPLKKSFHAAIQKFICKAIPEVTSDVQDEVDLQDFIKSHKELGCSYKEL